MGSKHKKNLRGQANRRTEKCKEEHANEASRNGATARPTEATSCHTEASPACSETVTTPKSPESPTSSEPPTYTSYSIAGGIAPEALFLPMDREVVPNADIAIDEPSAHEDNMDSDEETVIISTPCQSIETNPSSQDEHARRPFFHSFTDHDAPFSFGAVASMTSSDDPSIPQAFTTPAAFMVPESQYLQPRSDIIVPEMRSIFEALEERGYQETDVTTTSTDEAEPSDESLDAQLSLSDPAPIWLETQPDMVSVRSTAATMEQKNDQSALVPLNTSWRGSTDPSISISSFETLYVPKPYDHITLHGVPKTSWSTIDAWVRLEAERLFQANVKLSAPTNAEDASQTALQDLAMVPYHMNKHPRAEQQHTSPRRTTPGETSLPTLHSKRIFFSDRCGYTRLVDYTQTLYDVDVMMDDGASDFDSIASPIKLDPQLQPVPALSTTTSSEESDEGVDLDGISVMVGIDSVFHIEKPQIETVDFQPAGTQSFSEEKEVIDPCLVFSMLQQAASMVRLDLRRSTQPAARTTDVDGVNGVKSECHDTESDDHTSNAFVNISTLAFVDTAFVLPSPAAIASEPTLPDYEDHVAEKVKVAPSTKPFSPDWASELVRTKLGTESLFTFLEVLDCSDDGSTTKIAIAGAFMKLVNLEREKLGQLSLSASYTASAVTASKILPHTVFLGTASLGTFLEQFSFGDDGGATLEEVHRAFESASKLDLHLQIVARTGIMSMLGRRLGRLS